ncbi:enoyl-CoA delta isomerase 1, mitochondrial-like [Agrilus planipennis]|uniref:Enoyl-CoA delta isomerase 1, mitochondrial n=1 Tax=Agrilus planipennis TaxID=224129 RepID=A0A1W4WXT2_AGRPL|nr:enoyl-CoA delta isomerase 1, mitochondrial-like [Agrilus planipennis]
MYSRTMLKVRTLSNNLKMYGSTSSNFVNVSVNDKSGVAIVTMQREPVNSLNLELITQLKTALSDLERNKCRGMILTSASKSVFSAGLDIMEMYKPNQERVRNFWLSLQDLWMTLYGCSYPSVAAINGHSPAGGCLLSMSCEYRIMLPNFTIGLNETKLGIIAPSWFVATMKNTIGFRKAEMALTLGFLFTTEEALKVGLIDEVASSKEDAIAKADKFIGQFAKIPPQPRTISKLMLRSKDIETLRKTKEQDLQAFLQVVNDPKTQKGLELYLESLKQRKA